MQSHTVPVASVVIGGSGNIIVAEIMSGGPDSLLPLLTGCSAPTQFKILI